MKKLAQILGCLFLVGCAGMQRDFSSCNAESFGSDWIVVKTTVDGKPYRCWELRNVSITNERSSDGIYWVNNHGNLVHVSGFYDRVQVVNGNWENGFKEIGITKERCREVYNGVTKE